MEREVIQHPQWRVEQTEAQPVNERWDVEPRLGLAPELLIGWQILPMAGKSCVCRVPPLPPPRFSLGLPPVSQGFGRQFGRVAALRTGHRVPVEIPGAKSKVGAEAWQHLHTLSAYVVVLLRDPVRREPASPLWWPHIACGARCNSGHCVGIETA